MNENNGKEKNDLLIQDKIKNKKFNSSIISPKKTINKNCIKNKKCVAQIKKRSNTLHKENNKTKRMKDTHNSPEEKIKAININNLEFFQKNINNKILKKKKFQKLSTHSNNILNNNDKNKEDKIFAVNRKKNKSKSPKKPKLYINKFKLDSHKLLSRSLNSKKIKINVIKNGNNERNCAKNKKANKLTRESIKKENYVGNFSVDECDENVDKKVYNSKKKIFIN